MPLTKNTLNHILYSILPFALLVGAAAICYMALAHLLGYYNDDWYLIYAGTSQGSEKFHDVFAIDRPFRGYFVGWMFELLGVNPWLYSLTAFLVRCIGALGLLWILRLVWPAERRATFIAALLFIVYPGFLDQPNAIDYQSHIWSFTLAILSIGCTVQAFTLSKKGLRVLLIAVSLACQLISLLLMEYYIGLEGLRFLLVLYLTWKQSADHPLKRFLRAFLRYLPWLILAAAFTFWLTQIFNVQRQTVNLENMVSVLAESPALRLAWMAIYLFKDLLNVIIFAWAEPVYQYAFAQRLKVLIVELGLAFVASGLAWLALRLVKDQASQQESNTHGPQTARDMALLGLLAAALALIPIHFSDRQVIFNGYSRFSLPPSIGVALIFAGAWVAMRQSRLRNWFVVGLVTLAALAHIGNALNYADQWKIVRNFWWQVTWRAPQIAPDTVLMADYAGRGIAEDYFVWGPANLIYYPTLPYQEMSLLILDAATLENANLQLQTALIQGTYNLKRRGFDSQADFANLLVLSMPSELSCVHVIDGNIPEVSDQSRAEIVAVAPFSKINRILLDAPMVQPPAAIFGAEPEHTWCYYYQKASLARQRGDWEEVVALGNTAAQLDLRPYDWIEWMPFVEAYAYLRLDDTFDILADIINANPYYRYQACQEVLIDPYNWSEHYPDGHALLVNEFCPPKNTQNQSPTP